MKKEKKSFQQKKEELALALAVLAAASAAAWLSAQLEDMKRRTAIRKAAASAEVKESGEEE